MRTHEQNAGVPGERRPFVRHRRKLCVPVLLMAGLVSTVVSLAQAQWQAAQPDYRWSFPEDHWAHAGYKTEWWYFTGHLESAAPPLRRFGYQLTFFKIGVLPGRPELASRWATGDVIMAHAAVTDIDRGRHWFSEVVVRAIPFLGGFGRYPDPVLVWSVGPAGTAEHWQLRWNGAAFDFSMRDEASATGFALSTRPVKPLVLQGPGGFSRKGERDGEASQYYSFTRLATNGTLTVDGEPIAVTGVSWMDKEFGSNQLGADKSGWDWFSLRFEDGRELMLYLLRSRSGETDFARGTLVAEDGRARFLEPGDWRLRPAGTWTSPSTEARYPAGWTLEVPAAGIDAVVTPDVADQENRSRLLPGLHYWEGSVSIESKDGERIGRGYVELTGYGEKSRPPI